MVGAAVDVYVSWLAALHEPDRRTCLTTSVAMLESERSILALLQVLQKQVLDGGNDG